MNYLTPKEITLVTAEAGEKKATQKLLPMLVLAILAGAYIAFASVGATMATQDLPLYSVAKLVSGAVFTVGLMMVMIGGAELFTGNVLMVVGWLNGRYRGSLILRNWVVVYLGNLLGALIIVGLMHYSGLWKVNGAGFAMATVKAAYAKIQLSFTEAFVRGVMANWLVCLAVWMVYSAKDTVGRIWAAFFPIMLFVISGYEHSIANMYFIPAGIMAAKVAVPTSIAADIASLNWGTFLVNNLIPVTLGNLVGGAVLVGMTYYYIYLRQK
ncbi:MAG: formate/nitrite transporter family protein [Bacillota bacterium]